MISYNANVYMHRWVITSILILVALTWTITKPGVINDSQNKIGTCEQYTNDTTVAGQRFIPEMFQRQNYVIDTGTYVGVEQESPISNIAMRGPPS